MNRYKKLTWVTKNQALAQLREDWLKHYRAILTDPKTTKEQKELARKEIKILIGVN